MPSAWTQENVAAKHASAGEQVWRAERHGTTDGNLSVPTSLAPTVC